jgi:hypothetical protein
MADSAVQREDTTGKSGARWEERNSGEAGLPVEGLMVPLAAAPTHALANSRADALQQAVGTPRVFRHGRHSHHGPRLPEVESPVTGPLGVDGRRHDVHCTTLLGSWATAREGNPHPSNGCTNRQQGSTHGPLISICPGTRFIASNFAL